MKFLQIFSLALICTAQTTAYCETTSPPIVPDVLSVQANKSDRALHGLQLGLDRAGDRLVSVGESGVILLSDDNGQTWRQAQSVPVSVTLTSVDFISPQQGWAVGHSGVIIRTQDGGENWTLQLDGKQVAQLLLKEAQSLSGDDIDLKKNAIKNASYFVDDGPDKPLLNIKFQNSLVGYAFGAYGLALKTQDSGNTWKSISQIIPNDRGMHLYQMDHFGDAKIVAGEQGSLFYQEGNDAEFIALESPYQGTFFGVQMLNEKKFLAYGLKGNAWLADMNAMTWEKIDLGQTVTATTSYLDSMGRLFLGDESGRLLMSEDHGHTFQRVGENLQTTINAISISADGRLIISDVRGNHRMEQIHNLKGGL